MNKKEDINIDALRNDLLERKAELQRISALSEDTRAVVELDQTRQGRLSRQDALMQQEMAKETHRRRLSNIERIENTLVRMNGEDYGYCQVCDELIAPARLTLDPTLTTCIDCASGKNT